MTFIIKKKRTLLIPSGPFDGQNHLHVIITEGCSDGHHLLIGFSSVKPDTFHDKTCVAIAGEHEFFHHESYALYGFACQKAGTTIIHLVEKGLYVPRQDMSDALFERVCKGIKLSCFTKRWAKDYYDKALRDEAKMVKRK